VYAHFCLVIDYLPLLIHIADAACFYKVAPKWAHFLVRLYFIGLTP